MRRRWINYAACVWALMFAAPHVWWALGFSVGYPGGPTRGPANHQLMMNTWRYYFDLGVIFLCILAIGVALAPIHRWGGFIPLWITGTMAWIASAMLGIRGVAGLIVDGTRDPVWWPAFLVGGLLFAAVAWLTAGASAYPPTSHRA
jgi:hypothetical protein